MYVLLFFWIAGRNSLSWVKSIFQQASLLLLLLSEGLFLYWGSTRGVVGGKFEMPRIVGSLSELKEKKKKSPLTNMISRFRSSYLTRSVFAKFLFSRGGCEKKNSKSKKCLQLLPGW